MDGIEWCRGVARLVNGHNGGVVCLKAETTFRRAFGVVSGISEGV